MSEENERTIWILTYTHRHGQDVSVYETEYEALASAVNIIAEWAHEIHTPSVLKEIWGLVNPKTHTLEDLGTEGVKTRWAQAWVVWEEYQRENGCESITIERGAPFRVEHEAFREHLNHLRLLVEGPDKE